MLNKINAIGHCDKIGHRRVENKHKMSYDNLKVTRLAFIYIVNNKKLNCSNIFMHV